MTKAVVEGAKWNESTEMGAVVLLVPFEYFHTVLLIRKQEINKLVFITKCSCLILISIVELVFTFNPLGTITSAWPCGRV